MKLVLRGAIGVVGVVSLWWAAVIIFDIQPLFVPTPADIVDAFGRQGSYLADEAWVTLGHTLGGFGVAVGAGLTTALVLASSAWLRDVGLPLLVALQNAPKVAFAPLLVVWLGYGPAPKITLVALLCFFPVLIATLTGLRSTPTDLIELAKSWNASRWRTFLKIRIPCAAPQIFTGLKLAISLALIGAVVAQITTPNAGLGMVIVRAGSVADTALAFAAVTLLAGIGIVLFYTVAGIERLLLPWARATTA